jgi:hypothetical protein
MAISQQCYQQSIDQFLLSDNLLCQPGSQYCYCVVMTHKFTCSAKRVAGRKSAIVTNLIMMSSRRSEQIVIECGSVVASADLYFPALLQ